MQTILQLLPFVFNSRGSNRTTGEANEYAASYGKFKPVYYVVPWPPRNDADAQRFYNHIRTVAWVRTASPKTSGSMLNIPKTVSRCYPIPLPGRTPIPSTCASLTLFYLQPTSLTILAALQQVGFDDIIGAIPFYGDFIGVILAAYMVFLCFIFGTPRDILGRMVRLLTGLSFPSTRHRHEIQIIQVVNVAIDGGVGIIPVLGDVFDTLFKSNLRNLALFEVRSPSSFIVFKRGTDRQLDMALARRTQV